MQRRAFGIEQLAFAERWTELWATILCRRTACITKWVSLCFMNSTGVEVSEECCWYFSIRLSDGINVCRFVARFKHGQEQTKVHRTLATNHGDRLRHVNRGEGEPRLHRSDEESQNEKLSQDVPRRHPHEKLHLGLLRLQEQLRADGVHLQWHFRPRQRLPLSWCDAGRWMARLADLS